MNEQLDGRIELGKTMWQILSPTFMDCAKANKIEAAEDLAALFAGFMASAVGAMIGSAGPRLSMQVLGAVSKSCAVQTVEQYIAGEDYKIEIAESTESERKERISPKVTIIMPAAVKPK